MKKYNTIILFVFFLVSALCVQISAQSPASETADEILVKQSALNYVEGFYSGDAARMEKAIHPDINKATPRDIPKTGRTILNYSTYASLIDFTSNKLGYLADTARQIKISILNIDDNLANVKIISANFTDYLQLAKIEDQWKIINVLFASGLNTPKRIADFNAEKETKAVQQTVATYLNGLFGADAGSLNLALSTEFNKVTFIPLGTTGKTTLRRQRYETFYENAIAGIGKFDEVYRDYEISVMDIYDGIAVVKCKLIGTTEYIQVYKNRDSWKILNCIVKTNTNITLADAMTVTAGNPMPDFSLPVYGGGVFKLSEYAGKNILLIFPRGRVNNGWCSYCPYQYLELEELQKTKDIEKKYNLKVAFVLPYGSDMIKDWMEKFPDGLAVIENVKNPQTAPQAGSIQEHYNKWAKNAFPIKFEAKADDKHNVIPVLLDEKHSLSGSLKIYTHFWDGVSADQNISSALVIDKDGILQLKYIGQMTEDRPSVKYLLEFIGKLK